jgi:mannose-6-phosphate isomerase
MEINNSDKDSFVIYMCVKGKVNIRYGESGIENIQKGESILIPASLKELILQPEEYTEILEIFIR